MSSDPVQIKKYEELRRSVGPDAALTQLIAALASQGVPQWRRTADMLLGGRYYADAASFLDAAIKRYPADSSLLFISAHVQLRMGNAEAAQAIAEKLLGEAELAKKTKDATFLLLADALREQGKYGASSAIVAELRGREGVPATDIVNAVEWIVNCGREALAKAVCLKFIKSAAKPDSRIHVLIGQLMLAEGEFEAARGHFLRSIELHVDHNRWFVLQALSMTMRYRDPGHPDIGVFEQVLRNDLHPVAKASALLGLGKIFGDLGEWRRSAALIDHANRLRLKHQPWSAEEWQKQALRKTQRRLSPLSTPASFNDFRPIFIVGLPRTGTTLIAERLSRSDRVKNRGELAWIPFIDEQVLTGGDASGERSRLARNLYFSRVRQDDGLAIWYIDKNPSNFMHLDRIMSLFPHARVIWCRRNSRDTAVSIFGQYFSNPAHWFSSKFRNIAIYAEIARRLFAHWQEQGLNVHSVVYEKFVANPDEVMSEVLRFVGIDADDTVCSVRAGSIGGDPVSTASAWQARQPVFSRSVGRWRAYAEHWPELTESFPDESELV